MALEEWQRFKEALLVVVADELNQTRSAQVHSLYFFWLTAFQIHSLLVNPALPSDMEFDTLLEAFLPR